MVSRSRQISGFTLGMLMLGTASSAFAQAKCDEINDGSPYQLSGARQYLGTVGTASAKPDEIVRALASAVRVLTDDPSKINNEPGRQFLLLRTWAQYLQQPGAQYVQQRGRLGFTTNQQGTHNLLMAMDSALKSLNQSTPKCAATFAVYKDKFFNEMLNNSIGAITKDKLDSAKYYANTALVLGPTDPRAWNVLVAAYTKQQAEDSAMYAMGRVVELSGTDTAYRAIRQQARYNLAVLTLTRAQNGQGDKSQGFARSKTLLEAYLKETPGDPAGTQALARILQASGDTTAMQAMFGDMLTSPEKFTYMQLFENASAAATSNRNAEAVKLFENGLAKNPNYRDALYNLANVYFSMKEGEKMMPVVDKLVSIDPNSAAAWQLKAAAWQLRHQKETDVVKKKVNLDSLLVYMQKKTDLSPQLIVTQLTATKSGLAIKGAVQNTGTAAGSWTIRLEFLDKDSKVVATKDVAVGPVEPGSSVEFSAAVEAAGAIAYRYAPMK